MTRVNYSIPISKTTRINGDVELDHWYMLIGRWIVELEDGKLIVRNPGSPASEVLLKVEA